LLVKIALDALAFVRFEVDRLVVVAFQGDMAAASGPMAALVLGRHVVVACGAGG
jgi:hypothetical protein